MRVIFMGTPHFAVPALQAILNTGHEVVAVYSQPPRPSGRGMKMTASPVHQLAQSKHILVCTPPSLKSAEAQAEFAAHTADIAVVAAYGLLLPQAILDAPKLGCINIHPSDLPRWRGAAPLQRTIMEGDAQTACCIMQMDAGLDTGDVILRETYAVPDGLTFGQLHDAMAQRGAALTVQALQRIEQGTATRTPQPTEGVYAAKISKADQLLDFTRPAAQLRQQLLGLSPVPGALTAVNGEPVKVYAATIEAGDAAQPPGTVLDNQLLVNCGEGTALRLKELQRAGKTRQDAASFLQGFAVPAGSVAALPNS